MPSMLYLYPDFSAERDDAEKQAALLAEFRLGCEAGKAIGSHYFTLCRRFSATRGGPFVGTPEETFENCVHPEKAFGPGPSRHEPLLRAGGL